MNASAVGAGIGCEVRTPGQHAVTACEERGKGMLPARQGIGELSKVPPKAVGQLRPQVDCVVEVEHGPQAEEGEKTLHSERQGLLLQQEEVVAPGVPEIPQPAETDAAELKGGPAGAKGARQGTHAVAQLEIASARPGPDLEFYSARPQRLEPLVDAKAAARF